ncbi:hypothetical protein CEXT_691731 [Caerostris extrusa]|uniref:Ycf15 n=1 Tax=Caerostris extrusa TaxID=172846 RepID=A0AAV4MIJ3_CAEEX|nr:hypothetical protein CEXT_691731 [Caerostris extrusa]
MEGFNAKLVKTSQLNAQSTTRSIFTCDIARRSHSIVPGPLPESGIPGSEQRRPVGDVEAERSFLMIP